MYIVQVNDVAEVLSLLCIQNYAWHPLLNCRQKGCKLKLGIYIDDNEDEAREEADMKPVDTAAGNIPVSDTCM